MYTYLVIFWSLHWLQLQRGQRATVQNYLRRRRGQVRIALHPQRYQMGEPLLI